MLDSKCPVLISAMIKPEITLGFDLSQWDLLIRQARRAEVLARLGFFLENKGILSKAPEQPLNHIRSAQIYADQFNLSVEWEVKCIEKALSKKQLQYTLLKGAAYVADNNLAAKGRIFSDVDILVAKDDLSAVEMALMVGGWRINNLDAYDQKYYRQWMHELPAMQHLKRRTTIDVHHNILPETCMLYPNAEKLHSEKVKLKNKNFYVLSSEDRVLHSAAHLFHEGEFAHGFRDISDLDLLIKEFSSQKNFWETLIKRSIDLNQQIPLYYALRYTSRILATPVPKNILIVSEKAAPGKIKQALMDFLFLRALLPDHSSCNDRWTGMARWFLYLRSHWLRMPFYLLLPHLFRKSIKRFKGSSGK